MSMLAFSKQLTTVAAQITTSPIAVGQTRRVTVVARSANAGVVSVGTSVSQPVKLNAGDAIDLYPDFASDVYVLSTDSGDWCDGFVYS